MVLIADTAYVNGDFIKLNKNTYQQRDPANSGRLMYFDINGKFAGGWRYQNGAITQTLTLTNATTTGVGPHINSEKPKAVNTVGCITKTVTTVTWACVDTGPVSPPKWNASVRTNAECVAYVTVKSVEECTYGGGGGNNTPGTGGNTGFPSPIEQGCKSLAPASVDGKQVNLQPPVPTTPDDPCLVKPPEPEPVVINIPFNGSKIDPKKETKCFDKTQTAKMTIYVQQPNPNTRDMMGTNSVGHTFVGITQGGITRSFGFYPDSPTAAVLGSQTSEIHDNSAELYHVSIAKDISAAQLTSVINYINNYPPTYTLSSYNCTDFALGVAANGGLNLPSTTGTTTQLGLTFTGRNPGDLGEDIRNMTLPPGAVRSQGQSHAPNKSGTCP
ncbi:MAG: hypothetical protein V4456_04355 [Bacteroidota bacterium]